MRLQLPPPPAEIRPTPFPWMGALAPVLAAGILFALTRSPLSLAFAALGPLMAVAALVDGRRQSGRAKRADVERRVEALSQLSVDIAERHEAVRRRLAATAPSARELIAAGLPSAGSSAAGALTVRLGLGEVPSGIELEPSLLTDRPIAASAARVERAPVLVDARHGVGVVGDPFLTAVFARSIAVQLVGQGHSLEHSAGELIPTGRSLASMPPRCAVVVEVQGPKRAVFLRGSGLDVGDTFEPEMLGAPEVAAARIDGARTEPPTSASLIPLLGTAGRRGLAVRFAVGADGPLELDLVTDGPHALVGGTTGSGKSELLIAWLLALASARRPDELELLLFDFKGGASFDRITALPHVRGLVTDLDGAAVERAAASLGAEMRRREDELRARSARSIDECDDLARIVIVVDEFAAMLGGRSELHDVFADVAARGRSLGMHLVLCTQRPVGVMRDSLLANCGLRISLRVVAPADSTAVIGTHDAAKIPRSLPGRCLVSLHGEPPIAVQVASAGDDEVAAVIGRITAGSSSIPAATAGFLPPLPSRIPLGSVLDRAAASDSPAPVVVLGRSDLPAEGRQPLARWDPARDGALVVVGAPGSGRSTAARTIAAQWGVEVLRGSDPDSPERVWDELQHGEGPLVVDDLEAVLDRLSDDHLAAVAERLPSSIRSRSRQVAVTVGSPTHSAARPLLAPFGARLALRAASRDEHVLAGGAANGFDPRAAPGSGSWQGARVQIAVDERDRHGGRAVQCVIPSMFFAPGTTTFVVSTTPSRRLAQLASVTGVRALDLRGGGSRSQDEVEPAVAQVVVGDPEGWQAAVGLWAALADGEVVYDGCTVSQYRMTSRRRALPPALADIDGRVWVTTPEGATRRAHIDWER